MAIKEKEEILFEKWRLVRNHFVADGVADECEYLRSSVKLLFIMKELNDLNGGGWDLRCFMRNGARPKTWDNIARWVEGIYRIDEDLKWSELWGISSERRRNAIKSIAAINLKKSPGGSVTNVGELKKVALQDVSFLNEQIKLYNADYVICCGADVTKYISSHIELFNCGNWNTTSRGVGFKETTINKYLINYVHPEARVANNLLYYGLIDAIKEIKMLANKR